jgi:hypothetical protein
MVGIGIDKVVDRCRQEGNALEEEKKKKKDREVDSRGQTGRVDDDGELEESLIRGN